MSQPEVPRDTRRSAANAGNASAMRRVRPIVPGPSVGAGRQQARTVPEHPIKGQEAFPQRGLIWPAQLTNLQLDPGLRVPDAPLSTSRNILNDHQAMGQSTQQALTLPGEPPVVQSKCPIGSIGGPG
jgi:hypothetical protein